MKSITMENEGTGSPSANLQRGENWDQHVVSNGGTPLHKAQSGFLNTCDRTVISTGLYLEVHNLTIEYSLNKFIRSIGTYFRNRDATSD
jgi:hypothetical protein